MTPALTECIPEQFKFGKVKGRNVIANFQGGRLTSDRGLVLIAELDKKRQITARFASCFTDYRHQGYVNHSVTDLVAQRIYGLIQGYEDLNDHEKLRSDPVFTIAVGKLTSNQPDKVVLAGKSTLNRRLCCKNSLKTELTYQTTLVMQQLQKFETRILLALRCHLFLLVEFAPFVPYS